MKITVHVKPNSRTESVEIAPDGEYTVRVRVPPVDGKANARVQEILAEYFGCPKRDIELLHGQNGKRKVFEVPRK
jgi:uncharacterized protein (TIGR00251 family)